MMKIVICVATSFLVCAAAANAAVDPKAEAMSNTTAAAPSSDGQATERRYCVVETATGSHIERKTCKTRREWMNEGFDPLNP